MVTAHLGIDDSQLSGLRMGEFKRFFSTGSYLTGEYANDDGYV